MVCDVRLGSSVYNNVDWISSQNIVRHENLAGIQTQPRPHGTVVYNRTQHAEGVVISGQCMNRWRYVNLPDNYAGQQVIVRSRIRIFKEINFLGDFQVLLTTIPRLRRAHQNGSRPSQR